MGLRDIDWVPLTLDNVNPGKHVVFKTTFEGNLKDENIAVGVILDGEITMAPGKPAMVSNVKIKWDNGNVHNYYPDMLLIDAKGDYFYRNMEYKRKKEREDNNPNHTFRREQHDKCFQGGIFIPK